MAPMSTSVRRGILAGLLAAVFGLLLASPGVRARRAGGEHPANGAQLAQAPAKVEMRFTEAVNLIPGGIRLVDDRRGERAHLRTGRGRAHGHLADAGRPVAGVLRGELAGGVLGRAPGRGRVLVRGRHPRTRGRRQHAHGAVDRGGGAAGRIPGVRAVRRGGHLRALVRTGNPNPPDPAAAGPRRPDRRRPRDPDRTASPGALHRRARDVPAARPGPARGDPGHPVRVGDGSPARPLRRPGRAGLAATRDHHRIPALAHARPGSSVSRSRSPEPGTAPPRVDPSTWASTPCTRSPPGSGSAGWSRWRSSAAACPRSRCAASPPSRWARSWSWWPPER